MNKLVVAWVLFLILFTNRIYLDFSSAHLEILPLINVLITVYLIWISKGKVLEFVKNRLFLIGFFPFLFLNVLYPLLGSIFYDYPITSLYLGFQPFIYFSFIILGYAISDSNYNKEEIGKYLFVFVISQSIYSVIQFLYWKSILRLVIMKPLIHWDLSVQTTEKAMYGRSIGLFTNPNVLGFWSITAFWLVFLLLEGYKRIISLILILFVLLLSQSRGSIATLIVMAFLYYLFTIFRERCYKRIFKDTIIVFLSLSIFILFIKNIDAFHPFYERLISGVKILRHGFAADQNMSARFNSWKHVLEIYPSFPFGTLGSPEQLIKSFIDNQWIRLFAQGSFIFLIVFLIWIWGVYQISSKMGKLGILLKMLLLGTILNGLTQIPLSYSPIYLIWFLLGILIGKKNKVTNTGWKRHLHENSLCNYWKLLKGKWSREKNI